MENYKSQKSKRKSNRLASDFRASAGPREYLRKQKACYEDEFIRHIRFRKPVVIKIDGKKKIGLVMKM